jgi:hypothetical protein
MTDSCLSALLNTLEALKSDDESTESCLITGDKLEAKYITLACKHKFNYESLYTELGCQRIKNASYSSSYYSNFHGIKCPYCRQKIEGYLPLHSKFEPKKGVTHVKDTITNYQCKYTMKSGKYKGYRCGKKVHYFDCDDYCMTHKSTANTPLTNSIMNTCEYKFKKGKNKGEKCPSKQYQNNNFCKRHLPK